MSLLYFYCLRERGRKGIRIYHSGSPPAWRPIEWRLGDIRSVPKERCLEPAPRDRNRWAPHRDVMEQVVLCEPPSEVDLLIAGAPAAEARMPAAALEAIRPGG